jgi:hypothetical protein
MSCEEAVISSQAAARDEAPRVAANTAKLRELWRKTAKKRLPPVADQ